MWTLILYSNLNLLLIFLVFIVFVPMTTPIEQTKCNTKNENTSNYVIDVVIIS